MLVQASKPHKSAYVVVVGNEKGGSGKSTTAIHIAIALIKAGQRVATIDLDSRQKSLTHYVENRQAWSAAQQARPRCADKLLRRADRKRAGGRQRARGIHRLRRDHRGGRAQSRFRRHRYAGQRQLSDAAGACDGRHPDHPAQRQLRRFRRARNRRSANLCADRNQPLFGDGARGAPASPPGGPGSHRLDCGAQPPVARSGPATSGFWPKASTTSDCSLGFAPPKALPSG